MWRDFVRDDRQRLVIAPRNSAAAVDGGPFRGRVVRRMLADPVRGDVFGGKRPRTTYLIYLYKDQASAGERCSVRLA